MNTALAEPVTLCLINYNGKAHLQQAMAALHKLPIKFDEVLVVDNASSDDSLAYLETLDAVNVVSLARNNGPAGARNAGFLRARHDVILFQDNDISLTDGMAEALYQAMQQDKRILLTVPRVVYQADPDIIQFEGADCHFLGMMSLRHADVRIDQAPMKPASTSSMVSACFMIDRRRWFQQTQHPDMPLFDEDFIFNLEDHDLGVRASLLGFMIMVVPCATVLHGSGTKGLSYRPGRAVSATRMYCLIRNRWWIILRYYSLRSLLLLSPLLLAFELLQLAGLCLKGWRREWWRALVDTRSHFSVLCAERKVYQKQRRRGDRDILRGGRLPLTSAMNSGPVSGFVLGLFEVIMHSYWYLARKLL